MTSNKLTYDDLRQFIVTENWYRHGLVRSVLYTDGVKYVAETAGAYWLIDEIAFAQYLENIAAEEFQVWTLTVNLIQHTGIITCGDGNGMIVYQMSIPFTDFPLAKIRLYFGGNVLMLTTEY